MNRKLLITRIENIIWTAVLEDETIVELQCVGAKEDEPCTLGNIYVGRVKKVISNMQAAFVEIAPGVECYYSLVENKHPMFTKKIGKKSLCEGDEVVVQISKEAVKTKVPTVSSNISFPGKYAVLTTGDTRISVSGKIEKAERERLLDMVSDFKNEDYGIILRTNAKRITDDVLRVQLQSLSHQYHELHDTADKRVCFSCLKRAPKQYLTELRNINQEGFSEIVIEDMSLYEEVKTFLECEQPEDLEKLRKYEDKLLPLHKNYSIETQIEKALKTHVWLKSGAYLVIQPTEALTVIDVNAGKYIAKKKDDEVFLKINKEAAKEISKQIRLRNLSGIVIIDFINLDSLDSKEELLQYYEAELKKDPVGATLVDMTKLQLVEITRKKVRKPLHEALSDLQARQRKEEEA